MRRIIIASMVVFLFVCTTTFATDYVLIIGGVAGEKSYYDKFWSATSRFHELLTHQYGFSDEQITFLFEDEGSTPGLVTGQAKREPILESFAQLVEKVQPTDRFILLMIGHATSSSEGVKFNLPGRDITQQEYTDSINKISAKQQLLVFGFQYSARIVKSISAEGRVIITSSSVKEGHASQASFGDLFVDVFSEPTADANTDGAISLLEAYLWLQSRVDQWYEEDGSVQVEHPHLDDNGDGRPSRKDVVETGEGTLSDKTFLGKRLTPLPTLETTTSENQQEGLEQTPENGNELDEVLPPNLHEQGKMKGNTSLPYNFISEEDEENINKRIENAPSSADYPKNGAVILWEAEVYNVNEEGRHIYSTRRIIKIFNEDGYHYGEIKIPYAQGGDDVTIHHAYTLQPDGKKIELDKNEIVRGITPASAEAAARFRQARRARVAARTQIGRAHV